MRRWSDRLVDGFIVPASRALAVLTLVLLVLFVLRVLYLLVV